MSGFSELIGSFSRTREYIREFFLFGCNRRQGFQGSKGRTYDDDKRRAECWLEGYVRHEDSVKGRQVSLSVDSARVPENPLYQAYRAKSFNDNDIHLYFFLTDILAGASGPLELSEICDRLSRYSDTVYDIQTVRGRLKQYAEEGIVKVVVSGRKHCYAPSGDDFDSFLEQFPGLENALAFFSEAPGFGIVGNTLLRAGGMKNEHFFFKHNYLMHTLDDEVLLQLLTAASQKCTADITIAGEEKKVNAVPMQAAVSVQTGRCCLSAYVPAEKRFRSFRLDFIREARTAAPCEDYDRLCERYRRELSRCFGLSPEGGGEDAEPLVMTVYAGKSEDYIVRRLIREKRCGSFEDLGDGLYRLTFDVVDPEEVMRWAKTLICRTVSIEGGTEAIRRKYREDIRRMYEIYGGDADDAVQ